MRGWESQRSSAPLYPRGSITGSQGEQDGGRPTEEDFGEAMQFLPVILAKAVANTLRQEVTLLSKLYLLSIAIGNASWEISSN